MAGRWREEKSRWEKDSSLRERFCGGERGNGERGVTGLVAINQWICQWICQSMDLSINDLSINDLSINSINQFNQSIERLVNQSINSIK